MDTFTAEKIKLLEDYFLQRDDVLFVFIFGSRLTRTHEDSDWDVGVYFRPLSGGLEWESPKEFKQETQIYLDLTRILQTDNIDLVVLNRCPAHLADAIVRQGYPVLIRDRGLYLDFVLAIGHQAEDFRMLMQDYFMIYERSASLSQEDKMRLEKRIIFLENELRDFPYYRAYHFAEYEKNAHKKREIERWIENMMNAALDISKIILSAHKIEMPENYRDTIEKLSRLNLGEGVIQALVQWVQLRNIFAHEYLDLRWQRIQDFLDHGENAFLRFLEFVKKLLM